MDDLNLQVMCIVNVVLLLFLGNDRICSHSVIALSLLFVLLHSTHVQDIVTSGTHVHISAK